MTPEAGVNTIGVLTSGGDCPGMNAAIRAVTRRSIAAGCRVIAYNSGFCGVIDGESRRLELGSVGGIIDDGGTFLGTARCEEFITRSGQEKAVRRLREDGVEGLVVIGGDGSFRGAKSLHDLGFPTIGVPATIDNDVGCTDFSIGFYTAVNTVLDVITKIRDTASAHERVFVIEVMGRTSGWIALYAGLAGGADFILVPENISDDIEDICRPIRRGHERGKLHSVIVVAEGASSGPELADALSKRLDREVKVSVLGHMQRGGSPTAFDRILASRLGAYAVELLLAGKSGLAVGMVGNILHTCLIDEACLKTRQLDLPLLELADVLAL